MSPRSRTTSTTQDNTALVRAVYESYNARDFDRSAALTDDDAQIAIIPFGATFRGPAGMREFQRGWAAAFPDSRVDVQSVTVEGDRATVEYVGRGKHGGPFTTPRGVIAATGRSVDVPLCDVYELRDGKVTRLRSYFDAATMMTQLGLANAPATATQANVALARRWFEAMSNGQLDLANTIFAPSYRLHYPDIDGGAVGPKVIRELVAGYRAAFPDLTFSVDDTVSSGDMVVVRWTASGTNRGALLGAPATGRFARWTGMTVYRMRDGQIVEDWVETDRLGMLQQLGLAPAPEAHATS